MRPNGVNVHLFEVLEVMKMDDSKMLSDIKSAGGWFVGEYATTIFEKFDQLKSDKEFKAAFIKQIFRDRGRDSDLGGTRTRVNALIRIIERRELIEALEYIVASDSINKNDPNAIRSAVQTINKFKMSLNK